MQELASGFSQQEMGRVDQSQALGAVMALLAHYPRDAFRTSLMQGVQCLHQQQLLG